MEIGLFLFVLVCTASAVPIEQDTMNEFTVGNRRFSAGLYKEVMKEKSGNMVMSPFSVQTVMAMTHEGARGETAEEMVTGLSLPSTNEKIRQAFKAYLPVLTSTHEDLKMSTANKVYVGKEVKLEDDFRQVAENVYGSGVENVDFAENVEAAGKMNKWVEERTERKIKNLIDPSIISSDTKMVLVNTLYLKAKWETPFRVARTEKKTFHKSKDETVQVDMMQLAEFMKHYHDDALKAQFLEMPYVGGNTSMVIILPDEKDGLVRLEQNMKDMMAPKPFQLAMVEVQMPKFRIESTIEMIPMLQKMGIKKIFDETEADLSGLSSTDKKLVISDVVQKVFIDVDEAGTEAAAATAAIANTYSMPPPPTEHFISDHPFAFYIHSNGVILFSGRFMK